MVGLACVNDMVLVIGDGCLGDSPLRILRLVHRRIHPKLEISGDFFFLPKRTASVVRMRINVCNRQ